MSSSITHQLLLRHWANDGRDTGVGDTPLPPPRGVELWSGRWQQWVEGRVSKHCPEQVTTSSGAVTLTPGNNDSPADVSVDSRILMA